MLSQNLEASRKDAASESAPMPHLGFSASHMLGSRHMLQGTMPTWGTAATVRNPSYYSYSYSLVLVLLLLPLPLTTAATTTTSRRCCYYDSDSEHDYDQCYCYC